MKAHKTPFKKKNNFRLLSNAEGIHTQVNRKFLTNGSLQELVPKQAREELMKFLEITP